MDVLDRWFLRVLGWIGVIALVDFYLRFLYSYAGDHAAFTFKVAVALAGWICMIGGMIRVWGLTRPAREGSDGV